MLKKTNSRPYGILNPQEQKGNIACMKMDKT